jgi:hypothetical protein
MFQFESDLSQEIEAIKPKIKKLMNFCFPIEITKIVFWNFYHQVIMFEN